LGLDVVLLPEGFCEPLALGFPVVEAKSLLSLSLSLLVALALTLVDSGADVRVGWLLDCSSEAEADSGAGC
jgi:hypothetical protein